MRDAERRAQALAFHAEWAAYERKNRAAAEQYVELPIANFRARLEEISEGDDDARAE